MNSSVLLRDLFRSLTTKRSIFVSYHHGGDRAYYDAFSKLFADTYQVIQDNSVGRQKVINDNLVGPQIDSDDAEYVIRKIREDYITGSSCTVVLCGAQTPYRKFVDWEIKATLDKEHGLIAVQLPTNQGFIVPSRLHDNTQSGYAVCTTWELLTASPPLLATLIEQANAKAKWLIVNHRELRARNG